MSNKIYVAAHSNDRSKIVRESEFPDRSFRSVEGFNPVVIWGTPASPVVPWDGVDLVSTSDSVMPEFGGSRLMIVTFPPDAVMMAADFDPAMAGAEYMQKLPGLAEKFEPDNPGMHTTDTVDYDVVLEGEITLELDDGETIDMKQGDVSVQYGTRHAWRNKSDKPAKMLFVLIGAERKT